MTGKDITELLCLSALWGASFIFIRMGAAEFGPIPLMAMRVSIGGLFLLPILLYKNLLNDMLKVKKRLLINSLFTSAIPFSLLAYASLTLTAGFASVLNSTAPLWTALIATVVMQQPLSLNAKIGLTVGFLGVVLMTSNSLQINQSEFISAVIAGLMAPFCYGISAWYTKHNLTGVPPLAIATGNLLGASLLLLPLSWFFWPSQPISEKAWSAVIVMAIASTGVAYILYFRLLRNIGPTKAITVTYLVPLFTMVFGLIFLQEAITQAMLMGGGLILLGTAMATGVFTIRRLK